MGTQHNLSLPKSNLNLYPQYYSGSLVSDLHYQRHFFQIKLCFSSSMARYPPCKRITFITLSCHTKSWEVSPFASICFSCAVQRSPSKCLQMPNGNVPICCHSNKSVYYSCEQACTFRALSCHEQWIHSTTWFRKGLTHI